MLDKIDTIAHDVIKQISDKDRQILSGEKMANAQNWVDQAAARWICTEVEIALARWIRNQYGLWTTNPLTAVWRDNPDTRNIIDGVDHSYYHPDAVSARIVEYIQSHLAYYPGRKCKLVWPYRPAKNNLTHPDGKGIYTIDGDVVCKIIKRTKGGLIEIAPEQYPKARVSIREPLLILL